GGVTYSIDFANKTIGTAGVPKYVTVFFGPANSAGAAVPWTGAYSTGQFALRFYINYDAGNFRLFVAPLNRSGSGGFYGSYTWSQVDVVNSGGTISCPIVIEPSTSGNKLIVGGVVMNDYLTASGGSAFMGSTYLTNVAFSCDSSTGCDVRLNGVWAIN
ncbi:MAG: hypothetical protein SPL13_06370, partial [Clostridia bacterium]|nr:hypothetical protein [Clostridia bacterium]